MQYTLCRHIKTNGTQCEAPSLGDGQWCFFHSRLHHRHSRFRPIEVVSESIARAQPVHLSALEDCESVQVALSVVINALASGQVEPRHATALLYGLQIASSNLARKNSKPTPSKIDVTPNTKLLWEGFEDDNEEDEDEDDDE
jgi:hypothetical protein